MAVTKAYLAEIANASDAHLTALAGDLAKQRTELREQQVAVAEEIESRRVTADLSPTQKIALSRHLATAGDTAKKVGS